MIVQCALCGATVTRRKRCKQYFCCAEHRNQWNREHVDFEGLSRGHRAQHLTELNNRRNPHCRVAVRGKANSQKARRIAEQHLGRLLQTGEVVHHMNGDATDNDPSNLLVMTDRQHKQLHMQLAMEQMEGGDSNGK